jgi:hypothetical protein
MGGHPWFYFVPYQSDVNQALQSLRQREFRAGRYNPAVPFPEFPVASTSAAPGAQHTSMEAALEASEADGTRSILDIQTIGKQPDYGVAAPLSSDQLMALFGTAQPTHDTIEDNMDFFEEIERGQGIYIVAYKDGKPSEIFFAGYSYD